jgi:hypothetical protein
MVSVVVASDEYGMAISGNGSVWNSCTTTLPAGLGSDRVRTNKVKPTRKQVAVSESDLAAVQRSR